MANYAMSDEELEVTRDTVRKLAQLYGLTILDRDLLEVTRRFRAMLDSAKAIEALDLEGIEPMPALPEREVRS